MSSRTRRSRGDLGTVGIGPAPATGAGSEAGSDLGTLARGGALSFVGTISRGVLGFVLVLVVTRGLGARGSGLFFSAVALFTILATSELGADTGMVRMIARYRALGRVGDVRTTLAIGALPVAALGVVLAAAVYVLAPQLAHVFMPHAQRGEAVQLIRLLAPFVPLAAVSDVLIGATRGFGTVAPYVAIEGVAKPLARPALVLAAIALGLGGLAVMTAWALPIALALPAVGIVVLRQLRMAERRAGTVSHTAAAAPVRAVASEFWRFSLPRGVAQMFQISVRWLDVLLVAALRALGEAGVYAAVSRSIVVGMFAIEALRVALAPQISELLAVENRERAEALYRTATWWLMALSWPLYLALATMAPLVLRVFGPEFVSGQTALLILSLGMLVGMSTGNVTVVLLMSGKSSWVLATTAVALTVNAGLNFALIPAFGMNGAAAAWVASIVVSNAMSLVLIGRGLRMTPFGFGFGVVAVSAGLCYGLLGVLMRLLLGASFGTFALYLVVATVPYLLVLARFRQELHLPILLSALSPARLLRRREDGTGPLDERAGRLDERTGRLDETPPT